MLTAAQVCHCLNDWQEGHKKEQRAFSVEAYCKEYDGILKDLNVFQEDEVSGQKMTLIWQKVIKTIKYVIHFYYLKC